MLLCFSARVIAILMCQCQNVGCVWDVDGIWRGCGWDVDGMWMGCNLDVWKYAFDKGSLLNS